MTKVLTEDMKSLTGGQVVIDPAHIAGAAPVPVVGDKAGFQILLERAAHAAPRAHRGI